MRGVLVGTVYSYLPEERIAMLRLVNHLALANIIHIVTTNNRMTNRTCFQQCVISMWNATLTSQVCLGLGDSCIGIRVDHAVQIGDEVYVIGY